MRRGEREVTDPGRIREIILSCQCCRLGFYDRGEVYIVPLNFGYEERDGRRVFYFHGAREGRKAGLIAAGPAVGFELDARHELITGKTGCGYSARFQSVIGTGRVSVIAEAEEKRRALRAILEHAAGAGDWDFPEAGLSRVCVFQLEVDQLSCKEHQ